MLDVFFFSFCLVIFTLIGLPVARLIRGVRDPFLLAPTLGYAITGVAATVLYGWGLPIQIVFDLLLAAGACSATLLRRQLIAAGRAVLARPAANRTILPLGIALAGALLLLLPKWTGGMQFAVFPGTSDDAGAYLASAVVYAHQPFDVVQNACASGCIPDALNGFAKSNLTCRPAVMLLYAVAGRVSPANMLGLHFSYLAFLAFCGALVLAWLFINLAGPTTDRQRLAAWAAAFAFPLGFWGQYVLDINAWSQLSSIPLLAGLVGLLLLLSRPQDVAPGQRLQIPWTNALPVALLTAGACYFYPENTAFHLAALGPAFLLLLLGNRRTAALQLALAVVLGVCTTALFWSGTMGFLLDQARWGGSSSDINWWIVSGRFYFGCDGWFDTLESNLRQIWGQTHPGVHNNGAEQLSFARSYIEAFFRQGHNWCLLAGLPFTALAGFAGLFFLTPLASWPWPLQMLSHVLLAALVAALAWNGIRALVKSPVRTRLHWFVGTMLIMACILLLRQQIWAAGKAVSFAAPYMSVFFLFPLFLPAKRLPRLLAGVWLACQLAFGCVRPLWATMYDLHHTPAYMPLSAVKRTCDFDFRPLAADLQHARFVCLNIPDPDLAHYAMLFLYSHGIAFRQQRPAAEGHIPRAAPGEWLLTCEPEPGRTGRRSVVAIPPGMQ